MKQSPILTGTASAIGMLLLILDSRTALSGAQEGLSLCIRTVIPSLFPFFVLSILLTGAFVGTELPILKPFGRIMGIPTGAESILVSGLLGGYPVGAQSIGVAVRKGGLNREDARRMLAFCNNAGPAFLFGMAASLFPRMWMVWVLWGIQIISAVLVSRLFPSESDHVVMPCKTPAPTLTEAMVRALRVMAQVCGWIILFRVVIAFFDHWFGWYLPQPGQIVLSGLLELSNGCCALVGIGNIGLRFVLCSAFLAFGGLCVTFQTLSVANGLDMTLYFPGKCIQTLFSLSLSMIAQLFLPPEMIWNIPIYVPLLLMSAAFVPFLLSVIRKKSGNPETVGV